LWLQERWTFNGGIYTNEWIMIVIMMYCDGLKILAISFAMAMI
jgi:hypothetical protein